MHNLFLEHKKFKNKFSHIIAEYKISKDIPNELVSARYEEDENRWF